jgi:8-oxo-dGTP pyrophosphatase MutT (NUDIX family)
MPSRSASAEGRLHRQAAALPYRIRGRRLEIALVTNLQGRRWVVPKGNLERGEAAWACAQREAHEEAGLLGRVERHPVGRYRYTKRGLRREVDVYLLQVTEELDEWVEVGLRRRKWVEAESAIERVREPGLKNLLAQVFEHFGRASRRRTA